MEIESKSYTLKTESGAWLGQVVITSDGLFASVTDWGNFSYAWRSFGEKTLDNFKEFLIGLNVDYFGTKLFTGFAYINASKKTEDAANRYAEKILPALQKILKEELNKK